LPLWQSRVYFLELLRFSTVGLGIGRKAGIRKYAIERTAILNSITSLERTAMRFQKASVVAVVSAMAIFFAIPASAQLTVDKNRSFFSPDQQFGIGFNNKGGTIQYALGPAFHIGLNLAIDFQKDSARSDAYYDFGPYAKFIFSGDVIKPYLMAHVGLVQANTGKFVISKDDPSKIELPEAEVRIVLAAGAEHFFNQNVGVYGHINLVDAKLSPSPSTTSFGLQGAGVGVEFFF